MNIGQYFVEGGTVLQIFFRTGPISQVGAFLIQVGTVLEAGAGSAGPIRIGNEGVTVTVAPWQG